ncbi:pentatricopeptide repeat (PPR) superfamily protein [Artemisia annua]|uniref:Pentatricopeptide repeat (PPR) superfamily protein n=1 Tax=Artemisia annua TaxID=35608 RepID=A0A2U1KGH3_ARTAN|nr:pentatricopeptide repeat (PPR) superfamily protein [Artemisia annua]
MVDEGITPNSITYNNLMRVHVKAGRTEKVLQVYNQMKRLSCEPHLITYNFLIETHCKDENLFLMRLREIFKARDVNAAHRLFGRMKALKCQPNTVTYNLLMRMFAESKSADMVLKLKEEMDENDVELNVNSYRILIGMYCALGHWNNAYKFFREMIEDKCLKPSNGDYDMVLGQLRKAGQIKKHEELVEKMMIEEKCLKPSHGDYMVSSQLRKAGQIKTYEISVENMIGVLLLDLCSRTRTLVYKDLKDVPTPAMNIAVSYDLIRPSKSQKNYFGF